MGTGTNNYRHSPTRLRVCEIDLAAASIAYALARGKSPATYGKTDGEPACFQEMTRTESTTTDRDLILEAD
jgi:hypothetical protein